MICSCCGHEILDKPHSVDDGTRNVCDKCWNNPDLFFSEKLEDTPRMKILSDLAEEARTHSNISRVEVIRLVQKNIEMYVGKMKSKDLLELCEIDKFEEEELTGYQREVYRERTSELVEYLDQCPIAVMPGLFVSLRNADFVSLNGDIGILEIPRKRGAIWIIDGQHRIGGFEKIRDRFTFERNPEITSELFSSLMDYELPVVFINSFTTAEKISCSEPFEGKKQRARITPEDLERAIFFIVNKTQKGINPSLKDALLYRIKIGGIEGIPILRKESWRADAAFIGVKLNRDINSPLYDLINISGKREQGKPIQLNSFVSSLEKLFRNNMFLNTSNEEKLHYIKVYWNVLRSMFPEAFKSEESRNYMLLKALGVYSLNWLALSILEKCAEQKLDYCDETILNKILNPLRLFDWKVQTSPLSTLGGMKGVQEAHRILRECVFLAAKKSIVPSPLISKSQREFNQPSELPAQT